MDNKQAIDELKALRGRFEQELAACQQLQADVYEWQKTGGSLAASLRNAAGRMKRTIDRCEEVQGFLRECIGSVDDPADWWKGTPDA